VNEYRVLVHHDEKVLEMDDGDGCTIMRIYLEMFKMSNFTYIYLAQILKSCHCLYFSDCIAQIGI
jgi:hypothetical protein